MRRGLTGILSLLFLFLTLPFGLVDGLVQARTDGALSERIASIMDRAEFRHSIFGIEFYSFEEKKAIYTMNADKFFVPGSTTKLLTEGTALELLGSDYRFHTRVYKTGPVSADGTLDGDVVLVASGDPNLSGRIRPDDTLAFEDEDHSYSSAFNAKCVPGDPLLVIHELAAQIHGYHINAIRGRVLVDATMFPEGGRELGTGVVISPIVVNDNLIDVTVTPGAEGGAAAVKADPETSYVRFENHVKTGKSDSSAEIGFTSDAAASDGSHVVTISGAVPAGKGSVLRAYPVPVPSRFAEVTLTEALRKQGVKIEPGPDVEPRDFKFVANSYTPQNLIAEQVSAPLKEEVKVTLKVSQNLHASMTPFVLGGILGRQQGGRTGFDLEHDFLSRAGLDLGGSAQSDGAGGDAHFTPEFMVSYLIFMSAQKNFADFLRALPILGRDGTLADIQKDSPAAGHVFAKTGTFAVGDLLNQRLLLTGKGLAGYMTAAGGSKLAFAIYVNNVSLPPDSGAINKVGQAIGEIAAAGYELAH